MACGQTFNIPLGSETLVRSGAYPPPSSQRKPARLAARIKPMFEAEAKERQRQHGGTAPDKKAETPTDNCREVLTSKAADQAGEMLNVGAKSVERATKVLEHGVPKLLEAVEAGDIAISMATVIGEASEDVRLSRIPGESFHYPWLGRAR